PGEACRRLRRVLEDEARGEEQRLGMLLELAARRAGAHAKGGQLVVSRHKKPGPLVQRTGFFSSARFSCIYYAPASCGPSNRRDGKNYTLCGQIQIQLGAVLFGGIAGGIAARLDLAQVVGGHVAGDVDAVEAGRLEMREARVGAAHRLLQLIQVLVDERISADLAAHLIL